VLQIFVTIVWGRMASYAAVGYRRSIRSAKLAGYQSASSFPSCPTKIAGAFITQAISP